MKMLDGFARHSYFLPRRDVRCAPSRILFVRADSRYSNLEAEGGECGAGNFRVSDTVGTLAPNAHINRLLGKWLEPNWATYPSPTLTILR